MISVSEAIGHITRNVSPLSSESIALGGSIGRVLAEDIAADGDLPPFDRSQMDGFAVRSVDVISAPVELRIVGESAAGRGWHHELGSGEAVRIMTGAPVPAGADAIQKVELTSASLFDDREDATADPDESVTILESVDAGRNIVRCGAEIRQGERVFSAGDRITERMVAVLAAFGYFEVKVAKRPRVVVLTTGSEIVEIHEKPGRDQIRNSNAPMLQALLGSAGATATVLSGVADDLKQISHTIRTAAAENEVLVVTGGVSVGKYDLTKAALAALGAEIFFEKVRLKPGKPAVFARLGPTLIFGLPGNPVSAAVTFYLFVRKAILLMQSASVTDLRSGNAVAGSTMKATRERDTYLPAKLNCIEDGKLIATPVKWLGSSDFIGFAGAEALVRVAAGCQVNAGEIAEIYFF